MQPCILAAGGTRHQLAAPPWAAEAQPLPPPAGPCPSQQTPPSKLRPAKPSTRPNSDENAWKYIDPVSLGLMTK